MPKALAVVPAPGGGYGAPLYGIANTALGQNALLELTGGTFNVAVGFLSLLKNTDGNYNTAIGGQAMRFNTTGNYNTANGAGALAKNTTGSFNTANGVNALTNNTTGNGNTATGEAALSNNTTGSTNTALGFEAGTGITTADNVICIGHQGADVSNSTWINNIYQTTTVSGTTLPVVISDQGQLGTAPSAGRFKKEIKAMDKVSESVLALKPVTFRYKSDKTSTPQFGLVAEEVANVNPDLVVRDKNGEIYSVRYDAVNAMLLNEFLKEHRKVEEQQGTIGQVKSNAAKQEATISELKRDLGVLTA